MTHTKGLHPGAAWRKCDFQCHTPRDGGWKGGPELPGGDARLEAARQTWANEFIAECVRRGLDVVAVTDHHDAAMIPYVQKASIGGMSGVTVFPGVEITCKDNVQCLAILDPSCDRQALDKLLHMLKGVMPAPATAPKVAPVTRANMTIEELFAAIKGEEHLKDSVVLVPHFSDEDAHKSLNEPGHHPRFAELDCDGVYIEREYASLQSVTIDKIQGKIPEWGRRRRAVLATGDNRSAAWDRLGAHGCWIKLGEDSVEALRQAFLADEARITYRRPTVPSERIVQMTVQSSLTGPEPFKVAFNQGMTAIIGGRGSGKTALLEYLRFGLARSDRDLQHHEAGPMRERETQLVNDTLADGFVEVVIERAGMKETWRRQLSTSDYVSITDSRGSVSQLPLDEAQRRFPARAFYQKGLSSTTMEQSSAADQITGIAAAEEIDRRREVDQQIAQAKRDVTTTLQQLAAHWQHKFKHGQAKERVSDLKSRLHALSERLQAEGVSPENLKVLEDAPKYARAKSYFSTIEIEIMNSRSQIEALLATALLVDAEAFSGALDFSEVSTINATLRATKERIASVTRNTLKDLDALEAARMTEAQAFGAKDASFQERHARAVEQQTAQAALVDENTRLTLQLQTAEASELEAAAAVTRSQSAVVNSERARAHLALLVGLRRNVLQAAAEQVAGKSSEMLKARVKRDPKPGEYLKSFMSLLDRSSVVDAESKCDAWIKTALAHGPENAWSRICDGVLKAYEAKIFAGSPMEPGNELCGHIKEMIFDGAFAFTDNQYRRLCYNLTDSTVGEILSAVPRDYIVLTYVDDGRDIAFERASPGQQASALLELLLRQSAGTLIIDQPEDDIDNRIIMKVVNLIRSSKHWRQLIFATHNANIVVNGDADKVIALRSRDAPTDQRTIGQAIDISTDGAIETMEVRADITKIMEGGREAFNLRSRKYHFDMGRPGE